jgi:tRNA dimethylallyltransferase
VGAPISIAGPTASGKSAVAMEVAKQLQAEIISVDSMQVYRGLDIGTAKPSAAEQAGIPHHLIDCAGLEETYDAARFVREATTAERQIERPIFCGGTGLYFQAWQEGLGESPQADAAERAAIEAMRHEEQIAELKAADPVTFECIDQQNPRRVVRALEVIRLTGKPFSGQRAEWQNTVTANFFLIERERADLRARIEARVDAMFAAGLVEETCSLRAALEDNRVAQQALGYRQVIGHLRGEQDLPDTVALVKSRTWQFARRQKTWFRRLQGAVCLAVPADEAPSETARRILSHCRIDP